ncbi:UNVERIFIED_CONTAM: hypothetical protein K2H54_004364 [Gekko kuhli]
MHKNSSWYCAFEQGQKLDKELRIKSKDGWCHIFSPKSCKLQGELKCIQCNGTFNVFLGSGLLISCTGVIYSNYRCRSNSRKLLVKAVFGFHHSSSLDHVDVF